MQASKKPLEEQPEHTEAPISKEEKAKREAIMRKRLPHAVWFERIVERGGRVKTKPHKGLIRRYNAVYREIIMEIGEVPALVPWNEVLILTPMRYKYYEYGGQH